MMSGTIFKQPYLDFCDHQLPTDWSVALVASLGRMRRWEGVGDASSHWLSEKSFIAQGCGPLLITPRLLRIPVFHVVDQQNMLAGEDHPAKGDLSSWA